MKKNYFTLLLLFIGVLQGFAQTSITTLGTAVSQNFNTLPDTLITNSWTNNSTIAGWYAYETDPYAGITNVRADNGSANSGSHYSYGTGRASDRSFGMIASGSTDEQAIAWRLKNNSGSAITKVVVSYIGEQWRASNTTAQSLNFFYKSGATVDSISSGDIKTGATLTAYTSLDFTSPILTTVGAIDGNATANRVSISDTISVNIPDGHEIMLVWRDLNDAGNDHGLGIDDVSVTALATADTEAPLVISSANFNLDTITVSFNEKLDITSAETVSNYTFSPSVTITKAVLDTATNIVTVIGSRNSGTSYTLSISGVKDLAGNAITSASVPNLIYNNYSGSDLVITELDYNQPGTDHYEFVEIYNAGSTAIEMGGISFSSGIVYSFPEYSLPAKGFVVIATRTDSFLNAYGFSPFGMFRSGALNNSGEVVAIANSAKMVLDSVKYSNLAPWPTAANGTASLQLSPLHLNTTDNDSAQNWTVDFRNSVVTPDGRTLNATPGFILPAKVKIAEIRKFDANVFPIYKDMKVEISGIVHGVNLRANGLNFTLIDETAGCGVFHATKNFGYTLAEGDSIVVVGKVDQFNGLFQIGTLDTVYKVGTGMVKTPTSITAFEESFESTIVTLLGVELKNSTDLAWVGNRNYTVTNGTTDFAVRINSFTNVATNTIPTGKFNITGILGQFDGSAPYTEGYQLIPRYIGDIEAIVVGTAPQVSFVGSGMSVAENGGDISIKVKIVNPNTEDTKVDVVLLGGTAVNGTDFNFTTPQTVTFAGGTSTEQTLSVSILDNMDIDGVKTIIFGLVSATNDATLGQDSIYTVTITDNEIASVKIEDLKVYDENVKPVRLGEKVKVRGIVYGVNMRTASGGVQFTIIDETGGLGVFSNPATFGYVVKEGDEITVQGALASFNGLAQLGPLDTIILHSSNNTLKMPKVVTMLDESTESDLVKIEKVWLMNDTISIWPSNGNIGLTNGTDIFEVRVSRAIADLAGTKILFDTMNIVGLGGQFDLSDPRDAGYQLLPRYIADITEWKKPVGVSTYTKANITIYPNPGNGATFITSDRNINLVQVTDIAGKVIAEQIATISTKHAQVNVSGLTPGVYFVTVFSENSKGTAKLIVQ